MSDDMHTQLAVLFAKMTAQQQQEVLEFAHLVLQRNQMHGQEVLFYICPDSFEIKDTPGTNGNGRPFVPCFAVQSNQQYQPAMDENGRLQSRAPQWFLEAIRELYR